LFVTSIVMGVVGYRVHQCVHPQHKVVQEFTYAPENLDLVSVSIPTGSISVHTCSKSKNVTVKVTKGAKSGDLIELIDVKGELSGRALTISVTAPSFDLQHCQITHVEIIVPSTSPFPLSLSANAMTGLIRVKAKDFHFSDVHLTVTAGVIRASHVNSKGGIKAFTELGAVVACDLHAEENLTVVSQIGGTCLYRSSAKFTTLETSKGYMNVQHSEASEKLTVTMGYGTISLSNVSAQSLVGDLTYGRMWVMPNYQFVGDFSLKSQYGRLEVSTVRGYGDPNFTVKTPLLQKGVVPAESSDRSPAHVELTTVNGNVDLHLLKTGNPWATAL